MTVSEQILYTHTDEMKIMGNMLSQSTEAADQVAQEEQFRNRDVCQDVII